MAIHWAGGDHWAMPKKKKAKRELRRHFMKEWREFRGLTQEQAAARFDMDRTNLSKIERMKVPFDQPLLEMAADAYRCDPADIIMRNPLIQGAPWSLQDSLRQASPEDQARIQTVVEALLRKAS